MSDNNKEKPETSSNIASNKDGSKQGKKKKTNPVKADARSKFNASAAPIPIGDFFSQFGREKAANVDVVFDTDVQDRVAQPYVERAATFAKEKLNEPEDSQDHKVTAYALISITMARKMLMSIPNSDVSDMEMLTSIKTTEWFGPKAAVAGIDHIGKFEYEDKVARIKYNSQDIIRILAKMCKVMNNHSYFNGRYLAPTVNGPHNYDWDALDTSKIVTTSESSVRWMRDEGRKYLEKAYDQTWLCQYQPMGPNPADPDGPPIPTGPLVGMTVSYPRLKISNDPEKQWENVLQWLNLLSPEMPHVMSVISAGLATAWKLKYFKEPSRPFKALEKGLPAWFEVTPAEVLVLLGLIHVKFTMQKINAKSFLNFILDIHGFMLSKTYIFKAYLEMAKQPDNAFGSQAQLLSYKDGDFTTEGLPGLEEYDYKKIKTGARPWSISMVADKGVAAAGMIFGFTKQVMFQTIFRGETDKPAENGRSRYLSSDFKNVF